MLSDILTLLPVICFIFCGFIAWKLNGYVEQQRLYFEKQRDTVAQIHADLQSFKSRIKVLESRIKSINKRIK